MVNGHFGQGPSWHISWHLWFAPTGPQFRVFPQISPQLGIASVQTFRRFSSRGIFPQWHVLIISGLLGHISQFSEGSWHIFKHVWLPQDNNFWQSFPQEYPDSKTLLSQSTTFSLGSLHAHFWINLTVHGSQAPKIRTIQTVRKTIKIFRQIWNLAPNFELPLWHFSWQLWTRQFKRRPQMFSHMGVVPHRPFWLVCPHGQVLKVDKNRYKRPA